jgi:hypothetical protein
MDLDQQTWELSHQIRWALVSRNGSVSGPPVGYCTRGQYRTKCRENVYMLRNCHDTKSRIREDSIPPLDPDLNVKRGGGNLLFTVADDAIQPPNFGIDVLNVYLFCIHI